jgi:hypothetical protein
MLDEYEFYHGALIRALVVELGLPLEIKVDDAAGRIDSFVIDKKVAIHIKHSTKRLSPWQFTFSRANVEELIDLDHRHHQLFICLICGDDGFLCITPEEFLEVSGPAKSETYWIRAERPRNKMYEVSGNAGTLSIKKARGVGEIVSSIKEQSLRRFG